MRTPEEALATVLAAEVEPRMWRAKIATNGAPSGLSYLTIAVWCNGVDGDAAFAIHVTGAKGLLRNSMQVSSSAPDFETACSIGRLLAARVLFEGFPPDAREVSSGSFA